MRPPSLLTRDRRRRAAKAITEATSPAPTAAILLLAVSWHSAPTAGSALSVGLLAALFAAGLPLAYVLRGVRRGQFSDHHIGAREHRRLPLVVGSVSVGVGLSLLALVGAPRELLALVAAMLVGLTATLAVTSWWKISIHTSVVAGALVIATLTFGTRFLLLLPAVAVVGWSRIELDDHTPAQVAAGAALGAGIAAGVFSLLR